MTKKGVPTLEQFALDHNPYYKEAWWKKLPKELLDQIMVSNVGAAVVAKWLLSAGVKDATKSRCETLTRHRNELRRSEES